MFQARSNAVLRAVGALLFVSTTALGADHREAPLIQEDASADINDVYAFVNPNDTSRLVMIMTVNPFSAPSEAITYNFSPTARYVFNIDSTGDAVADERITFTFNTNPDGTQTYNYIAAGQKVTGSVVTAPTEGESANDPIIGTGPSGEKTFAGPRDDPFFFDVVGFFRFLDGSGGFDGSDGFAGYNVSAIAIDIPLDAIDGGSTNLQVWGTTERPFLTVRRSDAGQLKFIAGPFQQVDRMGNPAIGTALIPRAKKDFFNIGDPENDGADFAGDIVASLTALGTNATNINILASVAVPDTLKLDTSTTSGYPNGREPANDVIDTLFFFIFNQPTTPVTDQVPSNDKPFLTDFPFLAAPHQP